MLPRRADTTAVIGTALLSSARGLGYRRIATLTPASTHLGDALSAVAAAALTVQARLTPHVPIWTVIGRLTHWRLVPPAGAG